MHNERDGERDRRLTRLCQRVLELVPAAELPGAGGDTRQPWPSEVLPLTARWEQGRVDGVPMLPVGYLVREELADIRSAVLDGRSTVVGVVGRVSGVGLIGQGGIGKTVLATALARDPVVGRSFPDGIFWVTLGENADFLAAQLDLLARLGVTETTVSSVTQGTRALRDALAQRQCLLIVDDVWSAAAAKALAVTGPHGRVVFTTRNAQVLAAVSAQLKRVDVLSNDIARHLLAQLNNTTVEQLPAEVGRVLAGTGRVALALALVAAAVRGGCSWAQVVAELDRGQGIFGGHPYANTFKALQLAVATLDDAGKEVYLSLAVFPSDTQIPLPAIARYWHRLRGLSLRQTRARLGEFAARQLLTLNADQIGFHDLQHEYLLLQVDDLELLHTDLLAAYCDLLTNHQQWWQLPGTNRTCGII